MSKIFLVFLSMVVSAGVIFSQDFISDKDQIINGYDSKISGTDFSYHSFIPDLKESLLIRATTGNDFLEWESEPTIANKDKEFYTFIWIAALGSSPGIGSFTLNTDYTNPFIFYTDARPRWEIKNEDGSSLSFSKQWTDQHGDHHGYMVLRIPSAKIGAGQKVRIKVTGGKSGLTAWYMTFRKQIETAIRIKPIPATVKENAGIKQLAYAAVFYFGNKANIRFVSNGKLLLKDSLHFGYNYLKLKFDPVSKKENVKLRIEIGKQRFFEDFSLEPVKKWEINFIQHSHTDIGYTRSQTEILGEHMRYIDYALDYCDATDSYPEEAKFRWTCEASWAVDEFLKTRPKKQIERLKKRIKEGRIEVTAMYYNFSELPDEQTMAASLEPLKRFKDQGIPVKLAMQNDVNGIALCLNDYFADTEVKYLNMGTHGHRALICFDKPTFFWWESPSGNKMLAFRAEHYMTGNTLMDMVSGDLNRSADQVFYYLNNLNSKGYKYNEIAIQFSGYTTDNSPPSTTMSDLIKEWNQVYETPKLQTSTATAYFEKMEKNYSKDFEVVRGFWPDWWADGLGASAREVATTRIASSLLNANAAGLAFAILKNIKVDPSSLEKISLAQNALLFYGEHTTGYSESVREPLHASTMDQRALKDSYAWEAHRRASLLGEEVLGLLQSDFMDEKAPSLLVVNTLNWKRDALITVYIDHQLIPRGKSPVISDNNGKLLKAQPVSHRSDGTYWAIWLTDIPAMGFKKFSISALETGKSLIYEKVPFDYQNQWYKALFDENKGVITSIFDKQLGKEILDTTAKYKFGEFILEKLGNRTQIEMFKLNDFIRKGPDEIEFENFIPGDIWDTYRFIGKSETFEEPRGYIIEYRFFKPDKRIDVHISAVKKNITDPESFYISFPFVLKNGKIFTETAGGIIENGVDQIPGSSADWALMQSFTSVKNENSQIVISCTEIPLIQPGNINTGRFKAGAVPETSHIYSWPMNNYWTTNFNADQRGGHNWTYSFTSGNDKSNTFSTRFGWNNKIPFLTRVLPGGGKTVNKDQGVFISGFPDNVVLTGMIPIDESRIKLQIRELEGRETVMELKRPDNGEKYDIHESDANGIVLKHGSTVIKGYETKFFIIDLISN